MSKRIELRTYALCCGLFLVSFLIPLPVRTVGGEIVVVPAAILDLYAAGLQDYRSLDSPEKLRVTAVFLFLLAVHLAIVILLSALISLRIAAFRKKRCSHQPRDGGHCAGP
jgi:hypothetical protein